MEEAILFTGYKLDYLYRTDRNNPYTFLAGVIDEFPILLLYLYITAKII